MVFSSVFRFTTRQALPVSPVCSGRRPPAPSVTSRFHPSTGAGDPLYFTRTYPRICTAA